MNEPKASIADLQDEGFTATQFGGPADFATPATGYLARVLKSASLWVEQKCGPVVYAAMPTGSYAEDSARQAEVQYASMVLFRRRYAYYESNAVSGNNKDEAMVLAELRRKEDGALQSALYWLGEALRASDVDDSNLYDGSGLSAGVVETGRYPLTTATTGAVS
jgi:hypothetical protein